MRDGNRRFVAGTRSTDDQHRRELVSGQQPMAAILGCADSRVPVEAIFDCGAGDLFVVRVAGNIAAPTQIGSVEYAVEQLGTRLVVVLGHSQCGAVQATVDTLQQPETQHTPNVSTIVDCIRPAIERIVLAAAGQDRQTLIRHAVRANIGHAAEQLRRQSDVLGRMFREGELHIVGAEYSLETGSVDFFHDLPGDVDDQS